MLNVIDFVYADCPSVRDAWADLYIVFNAGTMHAPLVEDKIRLLLSAMATELGLPERIKVDDLGRIYYPNSVAKQQEIQRLQQDLQLQQLRAQTGNAISADDATNIGHKYPPRPSAQMP